MNRHFFTTEKSKGFALLLSIILSSVVLAIGLSILRISVSQLQLSATARESELALHASQSLNECLSYWRRKELDDFKDSSALDPGITCMGASPYTQNIGPVGPDTHTVLANDTDGYVVKHYYTFEWDNPANGDRFCSDGEIYFMVPASDVDTVVHDFGDTPVGTDGEGVKECDASYCGVLVTRGYNRPCDKLQESIFTVQRELTFEF